MNIESFSQELCGDHITFSIIQFSLYVSSFEILVCVHLIFQMNDVFNFFHHFFTFLIKLESSFRNQVNFQTSELDFEYLHD